MEQTTLSKLPAIGRKTATDDVVDALRRAIVEGDLPGGHVLNQVELAEHFGVSRVPVREAIRQLQAEGLVISPPHQRAVVRNFGMSDVLDMLEFRSMIEEWLLERSFERIEESDILQLVELCDLMDECSDHQVWLELNRTFHATLYAPAGSDIGIWLSTQLSTRVASSLSRVSAGIERDREANQEHRAIVDCLRTRDINGARKALASHIGTTIERVRAEVIETTTEVPPTAIHRPSR